MENKDLAKAIIDEFVNRLCPKQESLEEEDFLTGWDIKEYKWWKIKGFSVKGVNYVAYDGRSDKDYNDAMDSNDKKRNCFCGKIEKIMYRYKDSDKNSSFHNGMKLDIFLANNSNKGIVIESGLVTLFTRGLLLSLLNCDYLDGYFRIKPNPGSDNPENVFCEIASKEYGILSYATEEWKEGDGNDQLLIQLSNSGNLLVEVIDELEKDLRKADTSHKFLGKKTRQSEYHEQRPIKPFRQVDFGVLLQESSTLIGQLGWSNDQGVAYLLENYSKKSRQLLTDDELVDFVDKLKALTLISV
jgi:hypothetical protein